MKTFLIGLAIAACAWAPMSQAQTGKTPPHTATNAPATQPPAPAEPGGKARKSPSETIRGYTVERRQEAVAAARRATDDMDRQMERLQTQMSEGWSRMSSASRDRSAKAMEDLRTRRTALAEWVGGLKHGSSGAWTEVKSGFARSYDELAVALRKARAEFEQARQEKAPASKPADQHRGAGKGG